MHLVALRVLRFYHRQTATRSNGFRKGVWDTGHHARPHRVSFTRQYAARWYECFMGYRCVAAQDVRRKRRLGLLPLVGLCLALLTMPVALPARSAGAEPVFGPPL